VDGQQLASLFLAPKALEKNAPKVLYGCCLYGMMVMGGLWLVYVMKSVLMVCWTSTP
jgi:hypothetical protein